MHAATSKVENSAQGSSCQLKFVHAKSLIKREARYTESLIKREAQEAL